MIAPQLVARVRIMLKYSRGRRNDYSKFGQAGWSGFGRSEVLERLTQAIAISLPVRSAAEFLISEQPESADFFAAIKTGHVSEL